LVYLALAGSGRRVRTVPIPVEPSASIYPTASKCLPGYLVDAPLLLIEWHSCRLRNTSSACEVYVAILRERGSADRPISEA
jgi:hypothetical protein